MASEGIISVQKIVDAAIERRNQVRAGDRNNAYFHVSDAGTCYRKRYFKRLGVEPQVEIATASLRKMLAGDAGHTQLQELLKWDNSLFAMEGALGSDQILGHFDGIIKAEGLETKKVLLEIKTVEKWSMSHITGACSCQGTVKEHALGPKPEHVLQAKTYWFFGRMQYTGLNQMTLFYVKREDFQGVQFDYQWHDDFVVDVQAEWRPLLEYWLKRELPPCTCRLDYGGNGVKYCRYQSADGETCCDPKLLETIKDH